MKQNLSCIMLCIIALSSIPSIAQNTFPASGNVGIGTLTPQEPLDVRGTVQIQTNFDRVLTFNNTDNSWQYMEFNRSNARQAWMGLNDLSEFYLYKQTPGDIILYPANGNIFMNPGGGNVGIGTNDTKGYRLAVNGSAIFTRVKVAPYANWADYVFQPGYRLRPLSEVEQYIQQYKHLPEVPSAEEVNKEGFDVGDNQVVLLKKIEEMTLYLIEQNKQIKTLTDQNKKLEQRLRKIESKK